MTKDEFIAYENMAKEIFNRGLKINTPKNLSFNHKFEIGNIIILTDSIREVDYYNDIDESYGIIIDKSKN